MIFKDLKGRWRDGAVFHKRDAVTRNDRSPNGCVVAALMFYKVIEIVVITIIIIIIIVIMILVVYQRFVISCIRAKTFHKVTNE